MKVDILNTENKYQIVYADPPWQYKDKCRAGKRGAEYKYPSMGPQEIKDLPIAKITSNNSFLFLWVTFPMLQQGLDVIKAWGYDYRTIAFNWVKKNRLSDTWFWGMGNYTRSGSEICLLATKGKPKRASAGVHSTVDAPVEGHSRKPGEVRDRIVKLCGDLPRIELFSTEKIDGWDRWGLDAPEDIKLEA